MESSSSDPRTQPQRDGKTRGRALRFAYCFTLSVSTVIAFLLGVGPGICQSVAGYHWEQVLPGLGLLLTTASSFTFGLGAAAAAVLFLTAPRPLWTRVGMTVLVALPLTVFIGFATLLTVFPAETGCL